jgi:hypothetical protein
MPGDYIMNGVNVNARLKLVPLGNGLVDADWSVFSNRGRVTFCDMTVTVTKTGTELPNRKTYREKRKVNWSKRENGSIQDSWFVGSLLKCSLKGIVTIDGIHDYPIQVINYGSTLVR